MSAPHDSIVAETSEPCVTASWKIHPAEVSVFDRNAVALGVSIFDLMSTAAKALATAAANMLRPSELSSIVLAASAASTAPAATGTIVFLCGPGNNGGDGYAAALQLQQQGYEITIIATGPQQHGSEAQYFREQCQKAQSQGLKHYTLPSTEELEKQLGCCCLVVDCLLGSGFSGSILRSPIAEILQLCRNLQSLGKLSPVLACDMPSGMVLHQSSLELRELRELRELPAESQCLPASKTITFHAPKLSMYEASGKLCPEIGELEVVALPWPAETTDCGPGDILRLPPLQLEGRKGDRGRLLVIGGGPYHGAPMLAAQAAGRSGCDLVHLAMPRQAASRSLWPLYLIPENLPEQANSGYFDAVSCDYLFQRSQKMCFDAVLIGPGLGRNRETLEAVWKLILQLIELGTPLVLDADALFLLAQKSPAQWPSGNSGQNPIPMRGIVTPHRGELRHWLGNNQPRLVVDAASQDLLAQAEQQVILCSGSTDELTGVGGRTAQCKGGYPRMACAGTGDLLAGLCASFLAQGMSPWAAARLAAYILRQAGSLAGSELGIGLVADDLPLYIGRALQQALQKL